MSVYPHSLHFVKIIQECRYPYPLERFGVFRFMQGYVIGTLKTLFQGYRFKGAGFTRGRQFQQPDLIDEFKFQAITKRKITHKCSLLNERELNDGRTKVFRHIGSIIFISEDFHFNCLKYFLCIISTVFIEYFN